MLDHGALVAELRWWAPWGIALVVHTASISALAIWGWSSVINFDAHVARGREPIVASIELRPPVQTKPLQPELPAPKPTEHPPIEIPKPITETPQLPAPVLGAIQTPSAPAISPMPAEPKPVAPASPEKPAPTLPRTVPIAVPVPEQTPLADPSQPQPANNQPAGESREASVLEIPKPQYPALSLRLGESGLVELEVEVKADGSVGEIRIVQSPGFKRLEDAAITAIRQARFEPALEADHPIPSVLRVPFRFVRR